MDNNKIFEKVKMKIAISKVKEENDIVMENKTKNIFKCFYSIFYMSCFKF